MITIRRRAYKARLRWDGGKRAYGVMVESALTKRAYGGMLVGNRG